MSDETNALETGQVLGRLARQGSAAMQDVSVVTSPGARPSAWAIKIKSLSSYNVYNVCAVQMGSAGFPPVEVGSQCEAINIAESFTQTGQLSAGSFAIMFRLGEKNIFYIPVP